MPSIGLEINLGLHQKISRITQKFGYMGIHRDFTALFLHTKEELVFTYPEFIEKTEKLLFKGNVGTDCIKYTHKLCRTISDYKIALHREGYLPDLRRQLPLVDL